MGLVVRIDRVLMSREAGKMDTTASKKTRWLKHCWIHTVNEDLKEGTYDWWQKPEI